MAALVPTRPFASDLITGLMLPDGIFVTMLGKQNINVQIQNAGAAGINNPKLYIESVSHPAIVYTPGTRFLPDLAPNATRVEQWQADFSLCPSGTHLISVIVENEAGVKSRFIKKIFVMDVQFDPATHTFHAETPEGVLSVNFLDLIRPVRGCRDEPAPETCCCIPPREDGRSPDAIAHDTDDRTLRGLNRARFTIRSLTELFEKLGPDFRFCPPGYLPHVIEMSWTPTPPYPGQYSDLPFQDPWWKILLCILAVLLLIAAAIAEAVDGTGSVTVGGGSGDTGSQSPDCCGVRAGGGGTSPIAAALVAAAAAAATAAGLSDVRDPMRRGQDATPPGEAELTLKEPEEAAQIIGGMVLTHQLVVTFDTDDCPFVPDGHVMVV